MPGSENTAVIANPVEKRPKPVYPFIIDCGLDKKGNIVIYEVQPLVFSRLGKKKSKIEAAFEKAFPSISFELHYRERHYTSKRHAPEKMLITDGKNRGIVRDFSAYKYIHRPETSVLQNLSNKMYQRLYLPSEVSPEYTLFDLSADREQEINRVVSYFKGKGINKMVLKHPRSCQGKGNVFIDSINAENTIRRGVANLETKPAYPNELPRYLLAESQKTFSRVSRKTKKEKPGFIAYRMVGIADEDGIMEYFIATKSVSDNIDSHQRHRLKCYFNAKKWDYPYVTIRHFGLKNKHFNSGRNPNSIPINREFLQKTFKSSFKLFNDLETMNPDRFKDNIDSLIDTKRKSEIASFAPQGTKVNASLNEEQKVEKLKKSLFALFKRPSLKDEMEIKVKLEKGYIVIHLLRSSQIKPRSLSLLLGKLSSMVAEIKDSPQRSWGSFFSPYYRVKVRLPNNAASYQTLMAAVEETKREVAEKTSLSVSAGPAM